MLVPVVFFVIGVEQLSTEGSIGVYVIIVGHQRRITEGQTIILDTLKTVFAEINIFTSGKAFPGGFIVC